MLVEQTSAAPDEAFDSSLGFLWVGKGKLSSDLLLECLYSYFFRGKHLLSSHLLECLYVFSYKVFIEGIVGIGIVVRAQLFLWKRDAFGCRTPQATPPMQNLLPSSAGIQSNKPSLTELFF